jgi:ribosome-associated heat shock protein Hsp15
MDGGDYPSAAGPVPSPFWQTSSVADSLRLDKFLWFARIVRTRAAAQTLAEEGRIRVAGRVIDRAHAAVRVGDVLSFAQGGVVRVLRVERLPARRGPPAEARALYCELTREAGEA